MGCQHPALPFPQVRSNPREQQPLDNAINVLINAINVIINAINGHSSPWQTGLVLCSHHLTQTGQLSWHWFVH